MFGRLLPLLLYRYRHTQQQTSPTAQHSCCIAQRSSWSVWHANTYKLHDNQLDHVTGRTSAFIIVFSAAAGLACFCCAVLGLASSRATTIAANRSFTILLL
jgi:hypothetical protein